MPGLGTLINVVAIVVGASLGVLIGHGLPLRTRMTPWLTAECDLTVDTTGMTAVEVAHQISIWLDGHRRGHERSH